MRISRNFLRIQPNAEWNPGHSMAVSLDGHFGELTKNKRSLIFDKFFITGYNAKQAILNRPVYGEKR